MYRGRGKEGRWGWGQKNLLTEENASEYICNFPAMGKTNVDENEPTQFSCSGEK